MCFRLGTDGLYCVTKGNISLRTLVFSWRAFFLSENLTSESGINKNIWKAYGMHKTKSDHARVCTIYHLKSDHARFGLLSRETYPKHSAGARALWPSIRKPGSEALPDFGYSNYGNESIYGPPKRLLYKLNLNVKSVRHVVLKSEISPLTLSSLASLSCSSIWARDLVRLVTWIS